MRIIAVATVLNEADIIGKSVAHLYGHGVDEIHVALAVTSQDGTREILESFPVKVFDDYEPYHFQPAWINRLMEQACEPGDWVIPFDADEFWYATDGATIASALDVLPDTVHKLHVRQFLHRDWNHRYTDWHTLGKVAFRYEPGAAVTNGNHDVNLNYPAYAAILDIREWQFRSFDHMAVKCQERVATLNPALPVTDGAHQRELAAMDEEHLVERWAEMQARPVTWDPIPAREA